MLVVCKGWRRIYFKATPPAVGSVPKIDAGDWKTETRRQTVTPFRQFRRDLKGAHPFAVLPWEQ
jgi:hypothetical protein